MMYSFISMRIGFRLLCASTVFFILSSLVSWVYAEPSREPILRIETGDHLSMITRVSADSSGRWIVTGSEDKTVRLWDAHTGLPLSVLRPPIGKDNLGAIYSAVLSPDGRTVAMGGNSNFGDGTGHLMHLFDRISATIPPKSTLTGFDAPITQLAWSPDSQLIAMGLRQGGLRLFRRNLQLVGSDPEYNEAVFGVDFSRSGRLVVAAIDGSIRLYRLGRSGLERTARFVAPGGRPYGIVFSPDEKKIAIGYQDTARIDVLDSTTFDVIRRMDLGQGNLGRVAWSADGEYLFAAGSYNRSGKFPVLAFPHKGMGAATDAGYFSNTIMSLAALPEGRVVAASAEPSWAVLNGNGDRIIGSQSQNADFRDLGSSFRINADASMVSFPLRAGGDNLVFDLYKGSLIPSSPPDNTLSPIQNELSYVENWKNTTSPKIEGNLLPMKQGEISRSLAINRNDGSFVLGTEWFVRRYAKNGTPIWDQRIAAPAWSINISQDGHWVVAGLGDGSVRWFRAEDGSEQLALFAHTDQTRWIVWTPSGYYNASVAGEDLVGWHINRSFNQSADFFSAGRFRARLYRPDVIQKILLTRDANEAVRATQADLEQMPVVPVPSTASSSTKPLVARVVLGKGIAERLPPLIELHSNKTVETDAKTVRVQFEVRSPTNAPIQALKVRVDGILSSVKGRDVKSDLMQEMDIAVPEKNVSIILSAENRHGKSDPITINVNRSSKMQAQAPVQKFDKLYVLSIGISNYPSPRDLPLASKDAEDFVNIMKKQEGRGIYGSIIIKSMLNGDATRQNILDGLKWIYSNVKEKDAGVVFIAGHGDNIGSKYFFVPSGNNVFPEKGEVKSEADFETWKNTKAVSLWVSGDEISEALHSIRGRAIFLLDTCHSGALTNSITASNLTGTANSMRDEKSVIAFLSSTSKQVSLEGEGGDNGVFTLALIRGLNGGADFDKTGLIHPSYLKGFITKTVSALTHGEQKPVGLDHGIDDPIAVVSPKN